MSLDTRGVQIANGSKNPDDEQYPGAMHSHSAGYHAIVIEGASKHWTENNDADSAPLQTPGDYWFQAGGQVHQDSFPSDEITTVFLRFEGPVDFFLAEK